MGDVTKKSRIRLLSGMLLAVFLLALSNWKFDWGWLGAYGKIGFVAACVLVAVALLYMVSSPQFSDAPAFQVREGAAQPNGVRLRWILASALVLGFVVFEILPRLRHGEELAAAPWLTFGFATVLVYIVAGRVKS